MASLSTSKISMCWEWRGFEVGCLDNDNKGGFSTNQFTRAWEKEVHYCISTYCDLINRLVEHYLCFLHLLPKSHLLMHSPV